MNERIKELAEQAGYSWHNSFTGPILSETATEKFAELIIRECAKVANRAENTEAEIRCMYDVITEHFGVER